MSAKTNERAAGRKQLNSCCSKFSCGNTGIQADWEAKAVSKTRSSSKVYVLLFVCRLVFIKLGMSAGTTPAFELKCV